MNFHTLPSLIALAILVAIFRGIRRQATSDQLRLWLAGWCFVLVHFVAQFVDVEPGLVDKLATAVSLGALELASIVFLISVSPVATTRRRQFVLAVGLGLPAFVYTNAAIWEVRSHSLYYAVMLLGTAAALTMIWTFYRKATSYVVGESVGCLITAAAVGWAVHQNRPDLGIVLLLAALNFVASLLFWRHFRRFTAGVLTTVGGFFIWGSVFPAAVWLQTFAPSLHVEARFGTSPSTSLRWA